MSEVVEIARAALAGTDAWIVGGAVRDELLGRETVDLDLALAGDPGAGAKAIARSGKGTAFALSREHGHWRVVGRSHRWQIDLTPVAGSIVDDLAQRDFTVNAMARPLQGGELLDPLGGAGDLAARRLRIASAGAVSADPLRVLRLARFAAELALDPDGESLAAARAAAPDLERVASERVFAELRAIVAGPEPVRGLEVAREVDALAVVLPELLALAGVEQSRFHHLDVHDHTLEVLTAVVALQRDPAALFPEDAGRVAALLAEPLADDLTRGGALRFGALLHDIAKPTTRVEFPGGRVGFPGHDESGAHQARAILARLRASDRLQAHVEGLTRHHLALGFLVHERPLPRRVVHAYLRDCGPVAADVTLLSAADRVATRGHNAERSIAAHMELAREILPDALDWHAGTRPSLPLRGDELADELGIAPGPVLGELLAELDAAAFAGEISSRSDAVELARRALAAR